MMKKEQLKANDSVKTLAKSVQMLWKTSKESFVFIMVVSTATGAIVPVELILSQAFLDSLVETFRLGKLLPETIFWLIAILLIGLVYIILQEITAYLKSNFADKLSLEITNTILSKCVRLPMSKYDDEKIYNKIQLATQETPDRSMRLVEIMNSGIISITQLGGISQIMFSFSWPIALVCILTAVPSFFVNIFIGKSWYKIASDRIEGFRFNDALKEIILKNDNIKELKLYNVAGYLKDKIVEKLNIYNKENKGKRKQFSFTNMILQSGKSTVAFLIKVWIIIVAINRRLSIGAATMYINAIDQFQNSIVSIMTVISDIYEQTLYMHSYFEVIELKEPEEEGLLNLEETITKIEFQDVYFKYPHADHYVINGVSFSLKANHTYALVGLNGTGKTTIIKLLLKLYTPTKGRILINNKDYSLFSSSSIVNQISAIFQDYIKYPLTLKDNIGLGDLSKIDDMDSIRKYAKYSGVTDFIDNLPNGYESQLQKVWADGAELSVGQWQKIAISRCMFRDAEVMIFDEPFSSLDAIAERDILQKLKITKTKKIILFVTHRYSNISLADEIFVLLDGKVIESGSHHTLMQNNGYYAELYNAQAQPIRELDDILAVEK